MDITAEQLNAFYTVAKEKSFTKAANKLFRTQPAISHAVQSLEQDLGEILFIRKGRTTLLTQAGQIYLEHVEEAFDTLDRGRHRIKTFKELREGKLSISTSDTTAYYILPDILRNFRQKYPNIEIIIHSKSSPNTAKQVLAHEADLGIVTLPINHPKLISEELIIREDVVICSPNHKLVGRVRISFKEFEKYPLLLLDHGSNTRTFLDEYFLKKGIKPKIVMELGSIEVLKKIFQRQVRLL